MSRFLLPLLLSSSRSPALAGGAARPLSAAHPFPGHLYRLDASPVTALPPGVLGALPDQGSDAQAGMLPLLMLVTTAAFAGDLPTDPVARLGETVLPCLSGRPLREAFLLSTPAAYALARQGFERQGYRVLKEVRDAEFPGQVSFLLGRGEVHVVGHWAPGITGPRGTIALCLRSVRDPR